MPRGGSFPLHIAGELIREYGRSRGAVLDPFCGKGTVSLSARINGSPTFALDASPEAVVCTRAKLLDVALGDLLAFITALPLEAESPSMLPVSSAIRTFYHDTTLTQILQLRSSIFTALDQPTTRDYALLTLALLLGILHGHASYSLSLPCAHAYSMSPAYVERFAQANGLRAEPKEVKACLIAKAKRCFSEQLPKAVPHCVLEGSAVDVLQIFPELLGSIQLLLTSPPYLNAQTYAKDNWLRLWLLGYSYRDLQPRFIETGSLEKYSGQMGLVIPQLLDLLRPGGHLVFVAGDVRLRRRKTLSRPEGGVIINTAELLADIIRRQARAARVLAIHPQRVRSRARYFHALSKSNGHTSHDLIERILIARKD